MTFRIARIDPSRRGGIIEMSGVFVWFHEKNKSSILVKKTKKSVKNRILPYFSI